MPGRWSTPCARGTRCSAGRCGGPAGAGVGAGIDADGRLVVETDAGTVALDAGEVHLLAA